MFWLHFQLVFNQFSLSDCSHVDTMGPRHRNKNLPSKSLRRQYCHAVFRRHHFRIATVCFYFHNIISHWHKQFAFGNFTFSLQESNVGHFVWVPFEQQPCHPDHFIEAYSEFTIVCCLQYSNIYLFKGTCSYFYTSATYLCSTALS